MAINKLKFMIFFLLLFSILVPNNSIGQNINECMSLKNSRIYAFVARDWQNVIRVTMEYITYCNKIFGSEDLGYAYCTLGLAYYEMEDFKNSIEASEKGVKIYYGNANCHLNKAKSFFKLNHNDEAMRNLDITEKVAVQAVIQADQAIKYSGNQLDKQLQEMNKKENETIIEYAKLLREEFRQKSK